MAGKMRSYFGKGPDLLGLQNKLMVLLQDFLQKDPVALGDELHRFARELYPICRSITGDGLRKTLAMIQQRIPLQTTEVLTDTRVFDSTVPREWNIAEYFIKSAERKCVGDLHK